MLTEQRNILLNIAADKFSKKGFQVEIFDTSADAINWLKNGIKITRTKGLFLLLFEGT